MPRGVTLPTSIFLETLAATAMGVAVFTALMLAGYFFKLLYHQLELVQLVHFCPYVLPYMLSYTLPMAVLAGTILTYGRLAADNEAVAAEASGVHPAGTQSFLDGSDRSRGK